MIKKPTTEEIEKVADIIASYIAGWHLKDLYKDQIAWREEGRWNLDKPEILQDECIEAAEKIIMLIRGE